MTFIFILIVIFSAPCVAAAGIAAARFIVVDRAEQKFWREYYGEQK